MQKEFVPYELAVKLKALGFDEYCMGACYYEFKHRGTINMLLHTPDSIEPADGVKAPLFQQAFRWFREKGYKPNIVNDVSASKDGFYYFDIWLSGQILWETDYIFTTYEEAELACLTKLIEIVEQQKQK